MRLRERLHLISIAVLALGLASALVVYAIAEDAPDDAIGYVVVNGEAYPVSPLTDRLYVRNLERFGGKASVLFDEFGSWFAGLWRGRQLGITIGCLSALASLALFMFARWLPPDERLPEK